MRFANDPQGLRLPIKLDTATNGEYAPIPLRPVHLKARQLAFDAATSNAKRLGVDRRNFLVSACGAVSSLLAMNDAYAAAGPRGSFYQVEGEAARDVQLARSAVDGTEFIFDVQGHFVNPTGAWLKRMPPGAKPMQGFTATPRCEPHRGPGELDYLRCIGPDQFVKDVFMDSDTDLMVLSFVPSTREGEPLTMEEAVATARIVKQLNGTHRLMVHGRVNPNQPGDLEGMDELAARYKIA
ncbi:MAG: amidohydrolase, partial [Burkholderiaceae bacterium]|nr:amidohydrolase [Burkholderiaceae bacterium]